MELLLNILVILAGAYLLGRVVGKLYLNRRERRDAQALADVLANQTHSPDLQMLGLAAQLEKDLYAIEEKPLEIPQELSKAAEDTVRILVQKTTKVRNTAKKNAKKVAKKINKKPAKKKK